MINYDYCRVDGCLYLAIGRCTVSHQPYCRWHLNDHLGMHHAAIELPLRFQPTFETCPNCHGPAKVLDDGQTFACRAWGTCGWVQEVAPKFATLEIEAVA